MAVVITEKKLFIVAGGTEGRAKLSFSVNNDTTTFVIAPGNSDVTVTGSAGLRTIDLWGFSNKDAQKAPQIVKSYNSTYDCDVLTFTTASGDDYDVWVEGTFVGN